MMAFEIAFGIMAVLSAALAVICFKLWKANVEMVRTNARLEGGVERSQRVASDGI